MDKLKLPDFRDVEEAEKYNRLAAMGWVNDVWSKVMIPLNNTRYSYWKGIIGEVNGLRVFDLGCGYGVLSETFAQDGANVVGMDASEGLINIARERAREQGLAISYHAGYAEQLNLDGQFDVVVAADVLEHVSDLEQTVKRSSAMVAKGGYYCFLTNNKTPKAKHTIITIPEEIYQVLPKGYHNFDQFITPETITELLKSNGIVVKEIKGVDIDVETTTFRLSEDPSAMYIGYGVKE